MSPLPTCSYCGEQGIHGSADECLAQLHRTVQTLKQAQEIIIACDLTTRGDQVLPQPLPHVQYIPMGVSGW